MTWVIPNAGQPLNHHGHPRQRPEIGPKAMHAGTLAQGPVDLPELWAVQLRLAAGPPRPAEGGGATALPRGVPAADALAADLQIPCDGRQNQPAARKQTSVLLASLSHPFKVPTWRKRHALSIRQEGFNVNILSEILSLYYAKLSKWAAEV